MARLGLSRDLPPWLVYGYILALSSHGLFSVHMKYSPSVSTFYKDISPVGLRLGMEPEGLIEI